MVAIGGNTIQILIKASDQASAVIDGVKAKAGGLGDVMDKLRGPMLAVGAAATGAAALSIKSFADFETAMAKITTIMKPGEDSMETFGDEVKRLATELPIAGGQVAIASGLYQTLSSGITDASEATKFLEITTKAAIGGSAELPTVILAATKAMSAFGLGVDDTERIMNVFAATVDAGIIEMPELASAFPTVSGMAAEMGMTLEETAGVLAGLTKVLPSADEATTAMTASLTNLLKPSELMKEKLAELGFESGQAAVQQLGLMGTLQALQESVGGDTEAMAELFGNVRALRAVFPALGTAAEDIATSIDIVSNSGGRMQHQFETMEKTTGARMTTLSNKFNDLAIRLGEALIPVLEMLVPVVEKIIDIFKGLDPVIQAAIVVIGMLMGAFALLWPVISAVAGAIGGAGGLGAVIALLTGPIGWVIAAVALLAAAWATNFGGIQDIAADVWDAVSPIFEKIGGLLGHIAEILTDVFGPVFQAVFEFVSGVLNAAWVNVFKPVFEWIMQYIGLVIDTFDALLSALQGDLGPLQSIMQKWGQFFYNTFTGIINAAWSFVSNLWNTIANGINNIINWLYNAGQSMITSIVNGLASIGWRIWNKILSFIPTVNDIVNAVWGVINSAARSLQGAGDYLVGSITGTGGIWGDFIARPGQPIQYFSPSDTVIGVKDTSALTSAGGARTINVYMNGVTFASDYDVDAFKRRLADSENEAWAVRQNR